MRMTRKKGAIGLDLNDDYCIALQLAQDRQGHFYVNGWSARPLPASTITRGRIVKKDQLKEIIADLLNNPTSGALDSDQVYLTLMENNYHHDVFHIDKDDPEFYESVFPEDGRYWNYEEGHCDELNQYIYSSSIPKDALEEYEIMLSKSGLKLLGLESSSNSLARLFYKGCIAEPILFINIGGSYTSLSIADHFGIHRSLIVPVGYSNWIDDTSRLLGTSREAAITILHSLGLRKVKHQTGASLFSVIHPGLAQIINESRSLISFYRNQNFAYGSEPVLAVAGRGGRVPGIAESLSSLMKNECRDLSCAYQVNPDLSPDELALLQNAFGAALYSFTR